jgi:hypothetical protein
MPGDLPQPDPMSPPPLLPWGRELLPGFARRRIVVDRSTRCARTDAPR